MDNNSPQPSSPQSSAKILIVEDDAFLRELYAETLSGEGFAVETAADGEDGYEKMKQKGWDLVLLDIIMPKMNGLEVIKKVKAEIPEPVTKCLVFLTNLDKDAEIKEALQYGDGYLIKSQITPGDMIKNVNVYLAKSQTPPTA